MGLLWREGEEKKIGLWKSLSRTNSIKWAAFHNENWEILFEYFVSVMFRTKEDISDWKRMMIQDGNLVPKCLKLYLSPSPKAISEGKFFLFCWGRQRFGVSFCQFRCGSLTSQASHHHRGFQFVPRCSKQCNRISEMLKAFMTQESHFPHHFSPSSSQEENIHSYQNHYINRRSQCLTQLFTSASVGELLHGCS